MTEGEGVGETDQILFHFAPPRISFSPGKEFGLRLYE